MPEVSIDQGIVLLAVAQELPATPLEVAMGPTRGRAITISIHQPGDPQNREQHQEERCQYHARVF
jgi:hypothetical protein